MICSSKEANHNPTQKITYQESQIKILLKITKSITNQIISVRKNLPSSEAGEAIEEEEANLEAEEVLREEMITDQHEESSHITTRCKDKPSLFKDPKDRIAQQLAR